MARKKKQIEEEPFVAAVDLDIEMQINIPTSPSVVYSPCAFGTDFTNWKNYVEPDDLEKTKKQMYPKIGSIVIDRENNKYRIDDIRLSERKKGSERVIPLYIFDLTLLKNE